MQAWIEGVSTRKVDDLVAALGVESGISKSEVSRICGQLDTDIAAWRERSLADQATPYVFLDATYCKARVGGDANGRGGRVVSRAVVIATASLPTGTERYSASTSVTRRTNSSGRRSCARCVTAACTVSSSSSATRTAV